MLNLDPYTWASHINSAREIRDVFWDLSHDAQYEISEGVHKALQAAHIRLANGSRRFKAEIQLD